MPRTSDRRPPLVRIWALPRAAQFAYPELVSALLPERKHGCDGFAPSPQSPVSASLGARSAVVTWPFVTVKREQSPRHALQYVVRRRASCPVAHAARCGDFCRATPGGEALPFPYPGSRLDIDPRYRTMFGEISDPCGCRSPVTLSGTGATGDLPSLARAGGSSGTGPAPEYLTPAGRTAARSWWL
jgi:hypothetical protein